MSQTDQILTALKKCLRAKGLTYRDVAAALELSEASVKRLFSEQSFSLKRLEEICRYLDMNLYDLARLTKMHTDEETTVLSVDQEKALAENPMLLTYFYLLLNGWSPKRIANHYELDELHQTRYLVRLDRLKLIELYPRNRVRLLTGRSISWRPGGAVRKTYEQQVKLDFLKSRFSRDDEMLRFESGELSDSSIKILSRKLEKLAQDFDELAELDINLPAERKKSAGLMLALRPWNYWPLIEQAVEKNR